MAFCRFCQFWLSVLLVTFHSISHAVAVNSNVFAAWTSPRGGIVRDYLYLEGGLPYNTQDQEEPYPEGLLLNMSLCNEINIKSNPDIQFGQVSESQTRAPLYVGGTMFTTLYGFYAYGGLISPSAGDYSTTGVLEWQIYASSPGQTIISPDWHNPSGVSNNVAFGAGASAPSEYYGFYFSGLQSPSGGPLSVINNATTAPTVLTSSMITLDASNNNGGTWTNATLPSFITPRAEGSLDWIPVGEKGILVAIGGTTSPQDNSDGVTGNVTNAQPSQDTTFLSQIPVYDIASGTWYLQSAQVDESMPTTLAQFCTVVAAAPDSSSFQIYVYGGYDGSYTDSKAFAQIWALSIPQFKWYPIYTPSGDITRRRMTQFCTLLNPTTMIVVGGTVEYSLPLNTSVVDIFDLDSLSWTGKYIPGNTTTYTVPEVIYKDIGGTATGGAPQPTNINSSLAGIFNNPYKSSTPTYTSTCSKPSSSSKVSTIVPAVVVPVVVLAIIAAILFWFIRKRKREGKRISWWSGTTKRESGLAAGVKSVDSESTHVPQGDTAYELQHYDYYARKPAMHNATEISGTPVTTPPMSVQGHGTPRQDALGSPRSGPSELPQSTHPTSTRDSMSLRDHSMYPVGFVSEGTNSNWGDDLSSARSQSDFGYPSMSARLFELPHRRSNERLIGGTGTAPTGDALGTSAATSHPTKPHHDRNVSSLSESRHMPASPTTDEDVRRSRAIDDMPSPAWSPTSPDEGTRTRSAYQGKFDEIFRDRQS